MFVFQAKMIISWETLDLARAVFLNTGGRWKHSRVNHILKKIKTLASCKKIASCKIEIKEDVIIALKYLIMAG